MTIFITQNLGVVGRTKSNYLGWFENEAQGSQPIKMPGSICGIIAIEYSQKKFQGFAMISHKL